VLGTVWAAWHLPLFVVPGTFQHTLGTGNARFWIFMASMVPLSVLITWVYNHSRRSTLSAALVHFTGNLCGAVVVKSTRLAAIELALLCARAVLVVLLGRRRGVGP
jgi:membrane protease YdiL (CAAX protease family)